MVNANMRLELPFGLGHTLEHGSPPRAGGTDRRDSIRRYFPLHRSFYHESLQQILLLPGLPEIGPGRIKCDFDFKHARGQVARGYDLADHRISSRIVDQQQLLPTADRTSEDQRASLGMPLQGFCLFVEGIFIGAVTVDVKCCQSALEFTGLFTSLCSIIVSFLSFAFSMFAPA